MVGTEESPPGSDPDSQAVTVSSAEGTTQKAPHCEKKEMSPDSGAHISQSEREVANPSCAPPKAAEVSDRDSAPEGKSLYVSVERASLASPKGSLSSPSTQEGSASSGKAEKASEDGFNWRKYGQKNVKGNEFIRSYYKCTHPNCLVKKQVERSLEGQITDTVYFGQHEHPKPHINVPLAIGLVVSIVEENPQKHSSTSIEEKPPEVRGQTYHQVKATNTPLSPLVATSNDVKILALSSPRGRLRDEVNNDDDPSTKRKKKENRAADASAADKATCGGRHIIQTTSEVDIVNDGYRWRKYGQKLVKGNPNPRSYYRCSSPGCPVKKHVERASHDPRVVMTTYEGQHDHDIPAARTVTRNPAGNNGATVGQDDEARFKSEEGRAVSIDAAAGEESADTPKLLELQTDESENRCAATTTTEHESKLNEQQKGDPSSPCKSQGEKGSPTNPVPQSTLAEEQPNSQLAAKAEETEGVCLNKVGKKPGEQPQVLNAAAVQS